MAAPQHVIDLTCLSSDDGELEDDDDLIVLPECPIHLAGKPARRTKSHTRTVSTNDNAASVRNGNRESYDRKPSQKSLLRNNTVVDDDCCILDEDPSRALVKCDAVSNSEEELVVTGQRGQVACRDYPHARHACVQFPFATTPHEEFCSQCYCYICDAPAPCARWGNGSGDRRQRNHCNASGSGEAWDKLRKKASRKRKRFVTGDDEEDTAASATCRIVLRFHMQQESWRTCPTSWP